MTKKNKTINEGSTMNGSPGVKRGKYQFCPKEGKHVFYRYHYGKFKWCKYIFCKYHECELIIERGHECRCRQRPGSLSSWWDGISATTTETTEKQNTIPTIENAEKRTLRGMEIAEKQMFWDHTETAAKQTIPDKDTVEEQTLWET